MSNSLTSIFNYWLFWTNMSQEDASLWVLWAFWLVKLTEMKQDFKQCQTFWLKELPIGQAHLKRCTWCKKGGDSNLFYRVSYKSCVDQKKNQKFNKIKNLLYFRSIYSLPRVCIQVGYNSPKTKINTKIGNFLFVGVEVPTHFWLESLDCLSESDTVYA